MSCMYVRIYEHIACTLARVQQKQHGAKTINRSTTIGGSQRQLNLAQEKKTFKICGRGCTHHANEWRVVAEKANRVRKP